MDGVTLPPVTCTIVVLVCATPVHLVHCGVLLLLLLLFSFFRDCARVCADFGNVVCSELGGDGGLGALGLEER